MDPLWELHPDLMIESHIYCASLEGQRDKQAIL